MLSYSFDKRPLKLLFVLLLFLSFISIQVFCQKDTSHIQALKIGDKCPDWEVSDVINYPNRTVKLSDFKGKWLILDYWFVNCQPCIAMLPKCHAIQEKYKDKVFFLPVADDPEAAVRSLFAKMNDNEGVNYPSVVNQTKKSILQVLFPHYIAPHYVWIDPGGIVRAITDYSEMTEANIKTAIITGKVIVTTKNDFKDNPKDYPKYVMNEPLLIGTNGFSETFNKQKTRYQSLITGRLKIRNLQHAYLMSHPEKIVAINLPIAQLFQLAYATDRLGQQFPPGRTILEMGDSSWILAQITKPNPYYFPSYPTPGFEEWGDNNFYCYSYWADTANDAPTGVNPLAKLQKGTPAYERVVKKARKIMREDLERAFPIRSFKEVREVECVVLLSTDSTKMIRSIQKPELDYDKGYKMILHHISMNEFVDFFDGYYFQRNPVINATGLTGYFDIEVKTDLGNMDKVNTQIARYGLRFVKAKRAVEMLILKEVVEER